MVMQAIGAGISLLSSGMGLFSSLFGSRSSGPSVSQSKDLAKYQSSLDMQNYTKQLQLASKYQDRYLSNSAKATQNLNQRLMDYQYALERSSRQTSYQDTRKDLEAAGYNPLLAVGQQSNYVPVSSGVSAQSSMQEGMGNFNAGTSSLSDLASVAKVGSDIKSSEFINRLNATQSLLNSANTDYVQSQNVYQQLITSLEKQFGGKLRQGQLDEIKSRIMTNSTQQKLNLANANSAMASAAQSSAISESIRQNVELQQYLVDLKRNHPKLYKGVMFGKMGLEATSGLTGSLLNSGSGILNALIRAGRF